MRKALSAAVLVLAFWCPVSGGVIHNPPPEPSPLTEETVPGTTDRETASAETDPAGWSDSLTELAFDLLAVFPALLV